MPVRMPSLQRPATDRERDVIFLGRARCPKGVCQAARVGATDHGVVAIGRIT